MRPRLGVVIPAYNEEARLPKTLERIREYLSTQPFDWQVLVVDDGSTDATAKLVAEFSASDGRFGLHTYSLNRGKGHAVRVGMLLHEADFLLLSDADLAAPIEEVEKLFGANKPIAIGSRPLKDSNLEVRQPFYREWAGKAFNFAVRMLAIPEIRDTQCGFKLFARDEAKRVFALCEVDSYGYDFEALMIARHLGIPIAEVPIRWSHQPGSKVSLLRDGLRMLWDLAKLRWNLKRRLRSAAKVA